MRRGKDTDDAPSTSEWHVATALSRGALGQLGASQAALESAFGAKAPADQTINNACRKQFFGSYRTSEDIARQVKEGKHQQGDCVAEAPEGAAGEQPIAKHTGREAGRPIVPAFIRRLSTCIRASSVPYGLGIVI